MNPKLNKTPHWIAVYEDHHWTTTVKFRYKWQAVLFHLLLNQSADHAGSVEK